MQNAMPLRLWNVKSTRTLTAGTLTDDSLITKDKRQSRRYQLCQTAKCRWIGAAGFGCISGQIRVTGA